MRVILTIIFVLFNLLLSIVFPFWALTTILGAIVGAIAKHKGRDFLSWWVYGTFIFIIALPHVLFINTNTKKIEAEKISFGGLKKCNYCAELIKKEAKLCRFCGKNVINVIEKEVHHKVQNNDELNQKEIKDIDSEEAKLHAKRIIKKMKKDEAKNKVYVMSVLIIALLTIGFYFRDEIQQQYFPNSAVFVKNSEAGKYTFTQTLQLTPEDVSGYTKHELRLIRNEIFARYGFVFKKNSDLDIYFRSQDWYKENPNFHNGLLTKIERSNVMVIKKVEDNR